MEQNLVKTSPKIGGAAVTGQTGDYKEMTPTGTVMKNCELTFDSMFESGNLDVAVQVQPEEFNLYLKADTNTRGYCNWFFFKVTRKAEKSAIKFKRKKYMFNILNMYKKKTLFKKDAKPLACKKEILPNGFFSTDFDTQ